MRDVEREKMSAIEIVDGGNEAGPDLELVLRHVRGGVGIVVMTTHLLHPKHLHQLTEEDVKHLREGTRQWGGLFRCVHASLYEGLSVHRSVVRGLWRGFFKSRNSSENAI